MTAVLVSSVASVALTATLTAPATAAAPATVPSSVTSADSVTKKAPASFLFQYAFNGHLKIGGGNFTVGGPVTLYLKLNNGTVMFRKTVTAQTHPITPGGAIYVETPFSSPCAPGNNGYARAFDRTTQTWSPRLPLAICQRID